MRKTRSDSILLNLPEEQQAKLADWLLSGVPYHEAKVLVEKEFGISLKSLGPFQSFWREVCAPHLLERRRRAVSTADVRAEAAEKNPGKFDSATLDALSQKAYELAESPNCNPKDVKAVMMLLLKANDQKLQREQLSFDKQKFEFDAVKACREKLPDLQSIESEPLTEEEKDAAVRSILFPT